MEKRVELEKSFKPQWIWAIALGSAIGWGAFILPTKDERLVIERYDDYFGDKAIWDEVVFRIIPEDSTRVSELLTGGVDLITNVPPEDIERIDAADGVSAMTAEIQRVMMLVLRTAEGWPTADPKVREAIDLAIDKQGIIDSILGGSGTVTKTRVTPGNFGANEELFGQTNYDPERAKELLAEAGYEDGLEITFSATNGRYLKDKEVAELIQAQLAEVGITVNLDLLEYSVFSTKNQEKSFEDMFMIGYGNSMFDAALPLEDLTKDEAAGETDYDNPEVEELLKTAESNMNLEERAEQYQKAQEIIAEDRPHIYLYQLGSIYGVSDRINFEPRLDELFYLDDITLK